MVEKMVHLGLSLCTRPLSDLCTIVSIGRYNAYTRGENVDCQHIASAQISPRSSALLDVGLTRSIQSRSRCFGWVHRPRIDFLWHPIPPCHAGVSRVFLRMSMTSQKAPAIAGLD